IFLRAPVPDSTGIVINRHKISFRPRSASHVGRVIVSISHEPVGDHTALREFSRPGFAPLPAGGPRQHESIAAYLNKRGFNHWNTFRRHSEPQPTRVGVDIVPFL